jgi:predicted nucleic acid-binding protein
MIVLDASVVLEVLLGTRVGVEVQRRILRERQALAAPHLVDIEVAHVLRRYAMRGELSPSRGGAAMDDLASLRMTRYPHDILLSRIWDLRENLTGYDAAYVALAERLDVPLLTCDQKLMSAPGHGAQVEVV